MIFWGLKFCLKSDFFGSMKDAGIFLGPEKKWIYLGCEKRTKGFLIFWVDKF